MTSLGSRCHSTSSHLNKNNIANILLSVVQQIRAQLESQPGSHWLPDALFFFFVSTRIPQRGRDWQSPTCIITHPMLPFLGSLRWLLCTDGLRHSLLEPAQTFVIARPTGWLGAWNQRGAQAYRSSLYCPKSLCRSNESFTFFPVSISLPESRETEGMCLSSVCLLHSKYHLLSCQGHKDIKLMTAFYCTVHWTR